MSEQDEASVTDPFDDRYGITPGAGLSRALVEGVDFTRTGNRVELHTAFGKRPGSAGGAGQ